MGMTIDEAKRNFSHAIKWKDRPTDESMMLAIDTMHKYQQIDEAIPILHDMYNYYNDVDVDAYVGFDNEDNNAIETALDTMRKYQKIQEIYKKWFCDYTSAEVYTKISEVVEDGKID